MIKVEYVDVWGFEHAIRGMRNPMNSWDKSDSYYVYNFADGEKTYHIGPNDIKLMNTLYKGGSEERKFLRMIHVSMDITAPLYWWKEFDTYKVGTVANSCSTMHKIHAKEFTMDDFSSEHLIIGDGTGVLRNIINALNAFRLNYLASKNKKHWWQMIQLLPTSYNQRRTVDFNYEVAISMINQRQSHKLDEWRIFVLQELQKLPYLATIMELPTKSESD